MGTEEDRREGDFDNARTKVRTLARLLKTLNDDELGPWKPLSYFLTGKKFRKVAAGVRKLSMAANSPQLALSLGRYVKQANMMKITVAVEEGSVEMKSDAREFKEMYDANWNNLVSSTAARRRQLRTVNKEEILPLSKDLVKFTEWIDSELNAVERNGTISSVDRTTKLAFAREVMFNKVRINEVTEIKVNDIKQKTSGVVTQDIMQSLSVVEKQLAKRLDVIQVRGKSTRGI